MTAAVATQEAIPDGPPERRRWALAARPWLAPLALLIVALAPRLWHVDFAQFDHDQATLLIGAADFLDTGRLPLAAINTFTIGLRMPPLITFVLAVPMLMSRNPAWIAAFQASLDAIATVFVYLLVRQLHSERAALAAGLLYAVSPAAIIYSRRIWNPSLVPLLCAIALWGLAGFVELRSSRRLAVACAALACGTELHLTTAIFLPLLLVAAASRWRSLRWRPLLAAAVFVAVTLAPYLYLQTQTGWADLQGLTGYLRLPRAASPVAASVAASLVGGDFNAQIAGATGHFGSPFGFGPLSWLLFALIVLGCAWALGAGKRLREGTPGDRQVPSQVFHRRLFGIILILWLVVPVLSMLRSTQTPYPHYMLGLLPAAAALAGIGVASLPLQPLGLLLVLAVLCGSRLAQDAQFQGAVMAAQIDSVYGVPLHYSMDAASAAARLGDGQEMYVGAQGDEQAWVFRYLLRNRAPVTAFSNLDTFVFPRQGGLYLLSPEGHALPFTTQHFGSPAAAVRSPSGELIYGLFSLPADALRRFQAGAGLQPIDVDVGHIVRLDGYQAPSITAGQPSPVMVEWRVTRTPPPGQDDLRQFGHLLDKDGQQWSTSQDFQGFPASDWKPGDTVLSWFDLRPRDGAPTGGYRFETGLYEFSGLRRLPVFEQGRPAGSSVLLGPLRLAGARQATAPAPMAIFGKHEIGLAGVRVNGQRVELTWSALATPAASYTVFIHVLDSTGKVIAQHDGLPAGGSYPTSLWKAGDVAGDVHQLPAAIGRPAVLEIGLYTTPGLKRLAAIDRQGRPLGDHVTIPLTGDGAPRLPAP